MRFALTSLFIISFFGLAVFGFAGMGMADEHGHTDCVATAVQGAVCTEALGTVGSINFHTNAAKFFSTAVFGASASAILLAFFGLAFGISILSHLRILPLLAKYRVPQFLLSPAALPKDAINSWLSLHEKRDPAFSFSFRPI